MCGRFSLTIDKIQLLAERFDAFALPWELKPHYNLAPTQETIAVVNWQNRRQLLPMKWGLQPYWNQGKQKTTPLINIRSESLRDKPFFKYYWEKQRCLIPADGFFEWVTEGKHKIPYRAVVKDKPIFAIAGLWEKTKDKNGEIVYSFALLTTEANSLLYTVHDRMPAILTTEGEKSWLNPEMHTLSDLLPHLQAYPTDEMAIYQVSPEVNSVKHDSPACIRPVNKG